MQTELVDIKPESIVSETENMISQATWNSIQDTAQALLEYCRRADWAGYDPYDALNSRLLAHMPFMRSQYFRIAAIQGVKRLPVNLRPLLLIRKAKNPKSHALFLQALLRFKKQHTPVQPGMIDRIINDIVKMRSENSTHWSWGYSFPWQTRTHLVPRGTPNLVCTSFVANALMDAYESTKDDRCSAMAISATDYILEELYWSGQGRSGFSYPLPGLRTEVHNANFLGAALLCRTAAVTGNTKYLEPALGTVRYSASRQRDDGSWSYGESSRQRWVDNFHTGYNLCALRSIARFAETTEFDASIRQGYEYYRTAFFREDGAPKYYHDRVYPLDIHSVAQSIITFLEFRDHDAESLTRALKVYKWAKDHMLDAQGYFYYQVLPLYTNRIPYMRWSQAWMLLALADLAGATQQRAPLLNKELMNHEEQ